MAVEENSKLTFKGDTVLIEKGDKLDDNAVIWVDDNCNLILLMLKQQLPAMVQSDYLQVKALVSLLMNF